MCKFKDSSTCIKIMLWLVLLIVNTKQAFPMQDPLQEKLGNLKTSLSELKIKLEALKSKLVTLKVKLEDTVAASNNASMLEQASKHFNGKMEKIFMIDDKTNFIKNATDLNDRSILLGKPCDMGEAPYAAFTCQKQEGPLGKYDGLIIDINKRIIKEKLFSFYNFDYGNNYRLEIGNNSEEVAPDNKLKEIVLLKDPWEFCLYKLSLLERVYISNKCKNLENLTISDCQNLKTIYLADKGASLEYIKINNCPMLKSIDLSSNSKSIHIILINTNLILSEYITELTLKDCPNIKKLDLSGFRKLKKLNLKDPAKFKIKNKPTSLKIIQVYW